jgi:hypothetical protein
MILASPRSRSVRRLMALSPLILIYAAGDYGRCAWRGSWGCAGTRARAFLSVSVMEGEVWIEAPVQAEGGNEARGNPDPRF